MNGSNLKSQGEENKMNEGRALRVADDTLTVIFSQESATHERVVISIVNGSRPLSYVVFKNIRCGENGTVEYDECFNTSVVQTALEKGALWLAGVYC